jgi:hypothetical protein
MLFGVSRRGIRKTNIRALIVTSVPILAGVLRGDWVTTTVIAGLTRRGVIAAIRACRPHQCDPPLYLSQAVFERAPPVVRSDA